MLGSLLAFASPLCPFPLLGYYDHSLGSFGGLCVVCATRFTSHSMTEGTATSTIAKTNLSGAPLYYMVDKY